MPLKHHAFMQLSSLSNAAVSPSQSQSLISDLFWWPLAAAASSFPCLCCAVFLASSGVLCTQSTAFVVTCSASSIMFSALLSSI